LEKEAMRVAWKSFLKYLVRQKEEHAQLSVQTKKE
jgi:hypothetical protein